MNDLSEKIKCNTSGQEPDINKKLICNMRDLNHVMRSLYEGKASQKRILIILNEVKRITQRDLTMRLGIQPGSASEILSKLEAAGLILRTINETDRRTADISLTKQGQLMAFEAAAQRRKRHREMFSCLSECEKEQLLALLEKVNEDWSCRYGTLQEEHRQRHCRHKHDGNDVDKNDRENSCGHEHNHEHWQNCGHECHYRNQKTEEPDYVEIH